MEAYRVEENRFPNVTLHLATCKVRHPVGAKFSTNVFRSIPTAQFFGPNIRRAILRNPLARGQHQPENFPILQAPDVQNRLEQALRTPSELIMDLTPVSLELRDFTQHRVDLFCERGDARFWQTILKISIKQLYRCFLPDFGAIMLHSSAAVRRGRAVIFLAPGGGGKTTTVRQAPAGDILGDDQIILRRQGDVFHAHSTPWGRIVPPPASAPLGAFFVIHKSEHFDITPLSPRALLENLWREHFIFFNALPRSRRLAAMDLFDSAVRAAPAYDLYLPLNGMRWEAIDACL